VKSAPNTAVEMAVPVREFRRPIWLFVAFCAIALSMILLPGHAQAACTVPNTISNGQVADATAVMGNFNALNNCVNNSISATGTVAESGNLSVFSSPNTITTGNLAGDCTTSGTLTVTCTRANGAPLGYFATGTDASQMSGTMSVNRFNGGTNADSSHFLRGDGVWEPAGPAGGGGLFPIHPPTAAVLGTAILASRATISSGMNGSSSALSVTRTDVGTSGVDKVANPWEARAIWQLDRYRGLVAERLRQG